MPYIIKIQPSVPPSADPIPDATLVRAGVMSPADKAKLNSLAPEAPIPAGSVLYNPGPGAAVPSAANLLNLLTTMIIGKTVDYIYDPSALATATPVYKTLPELMAAVSAGPPGARVLFKASCVITSDWILPQNTRWYSITYATGQVTVAVGDGVVIDNLRGIGEGLVVLFGNTAPCLTWTADVGIPFVLLAEDGAVFQRAGTAPLAQIADNSYGIYSVAGSPTQAGPSPTSPVMEGMGPGTVLIGSQNQGGTGGGIQPGDFSGQGTIVLQNGIDARVLTISDFPAFSGTIGAQYYSADSRNFGPQPSGTVLGVADGAPAGTLPTFQLGLGGKNAFTTLTASFIQPAALGTVTAQVLDSTWAGLGQILFVEDGGYYEVMGALTPTSFLLKNLDYPGNVTPGLTVPITARVVPGGLKGTDGVSVADIYFGGQFHGGDALLLGVPQYFVAAGRVDTSFMGGLYGLIVRTPRNITDFVVGCTQPVPAGSSLSFDLMLSIDNGVSFSSIATAAIPAGSLLGAILLGTMPIVLNSRLVVKVTLLGAAGSFTSSLSATVS